MEKRALLALILISVVLLLSNYVLTPSTPPGKSRTPGARGTGPEAAESVRPPGGRGEAAQTEHARGSPTAQGVPGRPVVVETPLMRLAFTTRGGTLVGAQMRRYPKKFGDRQEVQLIAPLPSRFLRLRHAVSGDTLDIGEMDLVPDADFLRLLEGSTPQLIVFQGVSEKGDSVAIAYRFRADSYALEEGVRVRRHPGARGMGVLLTELGPRLLPTEADSIKQDFPQYGIAVGSSSGIMREPLGKLSGGESRYHPGPIRWAGVHSKYFLSAIFSPTQSIDGAIVTGSNETRALSLVAKFPLNGSGGEAQWGVYLGPQDYYRIKALGVGMEAIMEYGWWIIRPFTRLILVLLIAIHGILPNYGVVIILFSLLVKVAFYPLTQRSLRASREMQRLQPLLKEIRERHKEDPQRMQQETLRLYREHKVNPLGGCLPMVIQMPVLWALFYVFQRTIEFRSAGFALWIRDLSAPDSPPILPILMGVSMFVQQRLNPMTDPKMAPMTYIMPVVLTVVFINFPSGLVLYWTINNLLSIGEQLWIRRRQAPVPVSASTS